MSRFYFHLKHGDDLFRDDEGTELDEPDQARELAIASAREILVEAIRYGAEPADALVIEDDHGGCIFIPLTEALPRRLRGH